MSDLHTTYRHVLNIRQNSWHLFFWRGPHEGGEVGVVGARLVFPLARHDESGVFPEISEGHHLVCACDPE